jgi:DNA (cytosine-5)-methyltransferase 1
VKRRHDKPAALRELSPPYRVAGEDSPAPGGEVPGEGGRSGADKLTCLDLFCGCGGFSLGMQRAGFRVLAAIDFNEEAVETFKTNFTNDTLALHKDLTEFPPEMLAEKIGVNQVDMIVGGPPCQGFSTARQRDGANHGEHRLIPDARRQLFREFLRYVGYFKPRIFVMENVLGIRSAAGGEYFTAVQKEARQLGYRVHGQIEDAWELGVPQKRRRQLFIGVRADLPGYFLPELKPAPRAEPRTWLGAAIGDLPILRAGGGDNERSYDLERRAESLRQHGSTARNYLNKVLEISQSSKLTGHVARPHSERDLRDFARLREGENSATAMRDRDIKFEFPYDKSSFKDRYTRQSRWHPCSTIVAHLSKDGLMFIHPTQNRSLTPREAARIQSFPDWFRFPKARTHAFRLIGNAVPPLVSEAVGLAAKEFLEAPTSIPSRTGTNQGTHKILNAEINVPNSRHVAALELHRLANLDRRALRALPAEEFLRGWRALLFLFPGLHPDNALDHGDCVEDEVNHRFSVHSLEQLAVRRYARSGWPVALELIGREAWHRYDGSQITSNELYCSAAQLAGLQALKKDETAA